MTVREFYVALGSAGDWKCREKIEKAVFSFKLHWKQELDDKACEIIAEQKLEQS